jgi:predicted phosphate transport protein (TIGR00153 family)
MSIFKIKQTSQTIKNVDKFFDIIDKGLLVFKEGMRNYLYANITLFEENLSEMAKLESEANYLRREIVASVHTMSFMSQMRGDILKLLERMDNIVDLLNNSLSQLDIEIPHIPSELDADFIKLTELSTMAVESVIPAARAYFRNPDSIQEKINRVYFYEEETERQSKTLKRKVFHEMPQLKLSEKFHLRYFALHIETLSESAEKAADLLSIMALKRSF